MDGFEEFFTEYDASYTPRPYDWQADSRDGELSLAPAEDGRDERPLAYAVTCELIALDADYDEAHEWHATLNAIREL